MPNTINQLADEYNIDLANLKKFCSRIGISCDTGQELRIEQEAKLRRLLRYAIIRTMEHRDTVETIAKAFRVPAKIALDLANRLDLADSVRETLNKTAVEELTKYIAIERDPLSWLDARNGLPARREESGQRFLEWERELKCIYEYLSDDGKRKVVEMLEQIGVTEKQFGESSYFKFVLGQKNPVAFSEMDLPCEAFDPLDSENSMLWDSRILLLGEDPYHPLDIDGSESWSDCFNSGDFVFEDAPLEDFDFDVVVLGRQGWDPEVIDDVIEAVKQDYVRVYSQEMFLAVVFGMPDPFDIEQDEAKEIFDAFRSGHPGLELLSEGWATWTKVSLLNPAKGSGPYIEVINAEESPLAAIGYHVGMSSDLSEGARYDLLTRAFVSRLKFVNSEEYMVGWGDPGSAKRLRRIADHITMLINRHSHNDRYDVAVSHWWNDLEWLKEEFYRGHMTIDWTSGRVHQGN